MPGRLTVTVPRVDIGGNSLPQFHRVWLARLDSPYPPQRKRTASKSLAHEGCADIKFLPTG